MKRHLLAGIAFLAASLIIAPAAEADSHGRSRERGHQTTSSPSRPGRSSGGERYNRPGQGNRPSQGNVRPGHDNSNKFKPGTGTRPSQGNGMRPGNGNNNNRPSMGNQPSHGNNRPDHGKPGYNKPGNNRPDHGNRPPQNNFRPGQNHFGPGHNNYAPGHNRPGNPPHHGYRPGPNRPPHMRPPMRPGRPVMRPWSRPVPPPRWRPVHRGTLMGNILGLSFGIAINSALDNLYYGGYTIDGYMNNQVYLSGVNQFNIYWPDATLFFGSNGLVRSQFFRPTIGYDIGYYNSAYNNLCALYGPPVSQTSAGYTITSTWFGGAGDYISLQYTPMTSGNYRYFTILTIGQ